MQRPTPPRGYLIDIEGVLVHDKRNRPVDGAVAWLEAVAAAGLPFCLVSNNTTHRPGDLAAALADAGFPVTGDHLLTALGLGLRWLREGSRRRILWLGQDNLRDYLADEGFKLVAKGSCDAVVLGANPRLEVRDLESALGPILDEGTDLVCLNRNMFFKDGQGIRRFGPGAWAAVLESLGGSGRVVTVGKPSESIYNEGLKRIGAAPSEALFISDDPIADLTTANRLGMRTAFVLTGKYPDHEVLGRIDQERWPDIICARLGDLEIPGKRDD